MSKGVNNARRGFAVLDRDGTLIVERDHLVDPSQVELVPGAGEGLRRIRRMGLGLVMITNQSVVARGMVDAKGLARVHRRLCDLLEAEGVRLDGIYVCPHRSEDGCPCRKPQTLLLQKAARELDFEPRDSFVIGDKESDIELGWRAGATTILVRTGYGTRVEKEGSATPDYVVGGVREAADVVQQVLAARQRGLVFEPGR